MGDKNRGIFMIPLQQVLILSRWKERKIAPILNISTAKKRVIPPTNVFKTQNSVKKLLSILATFTPVTTAKKEVVKTVKTARADKDEKNGEY